MRKKKPATQIDYSFQVPADVAPTVRLLDRASKKLMTGDIVEESFAISNLLTSAKHNLVGKYKKDSTPDDIYHASVASPNFRYIIAIAEAIDRRR